MPCRVVLATRAPSEKQYFDENRRVQGEWHGLGAELLGLKWTVLCGSGTSLDCRFRIASSHQHERALSERRVDQQGHAGQSNSHVDVVQQQKRR